MIFVIATIQAFLNIGIVVSENIAHDEEIRWAFYFINEFTGVYCGIILIPFPNMVLPDPSADPKQAARNNSVILFGKSGFWSFVDEFNVLASAYSYIQLPASDRIAEIFNDLPYRYLMEYFKQFFVFWLNLLYLLERQSVPEPPGADH